MKKVNLRIKKANVGTYVTQNVWETVHQNIRVVAGFERSNQIIRAAQNELWAEKVRKGG